MSSYTRVPRSIFGPLLLIGLGIVLLLINLNLLEARQLVHLARLWPLLLVGVGVNLLFARRAWVGNLTAVLLVGGALAFLLAAPRLNLPTPGGELRQESFSEVRAAAESAVIDLDIDRGSLTLSALPAASANLVEISALHNQQSSFNASGTSQREVTFELDADDFSGLFDLFNNVQNQTEIGLHPGLPLNLKVDLGAGNSTLNLSALNLTELDVNNGSGTVTISLPAGTYPVALSSGSGNLTAEIAPASVLDFSANLGSGQITLTFGADASGQFKLDAGSGNIRLTLPAGVGVEIVAQTGSGNLNLPPGYVRVSGTEQPGPSTRGTWHSPDFETAELKLYLDIGVGSGNITLETSP